MKQDVEVIKCGTPIVTKMGKINAIITAVCMRGNNINYEISYFNNGSHAVEWIYEFEFDINECEAKKPGFVNYETSKQLNQQ